MKTWGSDAQTAREAATLLPVAGAILLLPPFILVFAAPVRIAGIPLIVLYVFGVWASIILGAWLLARRHAREADPLNASVDTDGATERTPEPSR